MEYSYPIDPEWTREEITEVVAFLAVIEQAYEAGASVAEIKERYARFKNVVPSKGEEKQIGNQFEDASGYSIYRVMKEVKDASTSYIKMRP
ncbi:Uncharacterised protein family (UPF0223) [Listeria grayi]|uniref:Uncharacterized protein n=2 Tax=Listeria grayi TaxID=1641 RepID=A0A829R5C4_LISGR|nr:UPF0223 family protein [Listeria grayi]EUJ27680.1 hypothetical protein LMUR_09119 [Listeria grayi FSL F6-1183]STY43705.1 Uncharacterised protein family (UPF0223) [Listeria grayi]VEI34983.1 Uncharacterised protein family (UPF0223) [Listeria grayi]